MSLNYFKNSAECWTPSEARDSNETDANIREEKIQLELVTMMEIEFIEGCSPPLTLKHNNRDSTNDSENDTILDIESPIERIHSHLETLKTDVKLSHSIVSTVSNPVVKTDSKALF